MMPAATVAAVVVVGCVSLADDDKKEEEEDREDCGFDFDFAVVVVAGIVFVARLVR